LNRKGHAVKTISLPRAALLCGAGVLLMGLRMPAQAADSQAGGNDGEGPPAGWVGPPPGWSGWALGGGLRVPDYQGSRSARNQPLLGFAMTYRSQDRGSVEMGSRGLNWTLVQTPGHSAGVGLGVDPGRIDNGDKKITPLGLRPGSERLAGMGTIGAAAVLSAFGTAQAGFLPLTASVKHAAGSHEGTQADLGLALPWKIGRHAELRFGPSLTWADRRYMQAFFGVTAAQSKASRFAEFTPGAGLKSAQLTLDADMAFSRHWHAMAKLQAQRLVGDAAHSPVTEKRLQAAGWVGAMYQFQL
jgi:MipA family protein